MAVFGALAGVIASAQAQVQTQVYAQSLANVAGQTSVVVTLPFDGKEATHPPQKPLQVMPTAVAVGEVLMLRPQAVRYRVTPPDLFGGIARIKYHGKAPDLRAMARLLKATVMLGGWMEATPGPDAPKPYRLTLTLYDADGQTIGQLGYDLDTPVLNQQRFTEQATAFFQMLDGALHIQPQAAKTPPAPIAVSPAAPPSAGTTWLTPSHQPAVETASKPTQTTSVPAFSSSSRSSGPSRPVQQADDSEEAPLGSPNQPLIPRTKAASEIYARRPPWQPAIDVRAGYLYNTRSLSNEGSGLRFPRSGASGLVLNLEVHPLAFLKPMSKPPLAGLGLRLSAMLPFWGTIQEVTEEAGMSHGSYQASEQRIELALRWHWNFWDDVLRPDFEVEVLGGGHFFDFSNAINLPFLRIPSSDYRYMGALAGLRLYFTRWLSGRAAFSIARHLGLGTMATPGVDAAGMSLANSNGFQSYGPGSGFLWRMDLGLSAEIWRGLLGGLAFYYEQNLLSFEGQGNILKSADGTPVTRARDEYLGVMLTLGYYFRSRI